jgi:hypothetical protein
MRDLLSRIKMRPQIPMLGILAHFSHLRHSDPGYAKVDSWLDQDVKNVTMESQY